MADIEIRFARPADIETIAAHNRAMAKETEKRVLDEDTVLAGTRALMQDHTRGFYLLAELEGRVAGQLMVTFEWSDWRNGAFWWIQSVYVRPPSRGRGVFGALFEYLTTEARSREDICGLRLYAAADNQRAKKTYRALGMQPTRYELFELEF